MNQPAPLPRFSVIAAALRGATERLANELRAPSTTAPSWNEFEWSMARAAATMHGISMLLARRLPWRGPPGWHRFLDLQLEQGTLRERRVDAMLVQLDASLREHGVSAVALKGSALRKLQLYAPGERPMGDIDLLARAEDFPDLTSALAAVGYRPSFTSRRHAVFLGASSERRTQPFGEHIDAPLLIEAHDHIAEKLPLTPVDITARLLPRDASPGLRGYPDDSALLTHLLMHAAGNMRAHALRLVQLEDITRMLARLGDEAWPELLGPRADAQAAWWSLPPLLLARRYCGARIPPAVIARLRAACPPALRLAAERYTLTEVSWSNLRIAAFPGIAWSRNPAEALRFMKSRLAPGVDERNDLGRSLATLPQLTSVPWYQLPHRSRILRWLFGQPPRVQAINAVMAALDHDLRCQKS